MKSGEYFFDYPTGTDHYFSSGADKKVFLDPSLRNLSNTDCVSCHLTVSNSVSNPNFMHFRRSSDLVGRPLVSRRLSNEVLSDIAELVGAK